MSEATIEEEQTLTLIRLKPETRPQVGLAPDSSDDDATFFGRSDSADGTGCVALVIPESDPRNRFNGKHMCRSEFDIIEERTPDTQEEESDLWVGIVSPDYFTTGNQADGMVNGDDDSRTYFVTERTNLGTGWVRLIVSDDDPRVATSGSTFYHQSSDGDGRRGWNIEERYVTRVDSTPEESDPYPVGSRWQHPSVSGPVTIVGPGSASNYRRVRHDDGRTPDGEWIVGAFDLAERLEEDSREEPPRLQVGDTVRLIDQDGSGWGRIGDIGRVVNINDRDGTQRDPLVRVLLTTGDDAGSECSRYRRRWERVEETREEAPTEPTEASVTLTTEDPHVLLPEELEEKLRQAREEGKREERARLTQEHARWTDSLVEDAHEWANDNSLCGEFDRFMEEHGLPSRTREYGVEVTVSFSVEASDEDTAREIAREMVYNELPSSMDDNVVTTGCWRV